MKTLMATQLKGRLIASKVYNSAEPVRLLFELTNHGDQDLYVLKWYTPLEGLNSDCLTVLRNGKLRVTYDGPMIKRGHPSPEDYVLVPAGKTVKVDVDVSESYAVSKPAEYLVELNIPALEHIPAQAAGVKSKALALAKSAHELGELTGGKTEFTVKKGPVQLPTRGAAARTASATLAKAKGVSAPKGAAGLAPLRCPPSSSAARPHSKRRPNKPTSMGSSSAKPPSRG